MKDMAYPGYFVVGRDGVVTEKFFEEIYSDRHTPNNVLGRLFPELIETRRDRIRVPHLALRPGQSDQVAAPGNRVTLFVDIELRRGVHVYAPGVKHYRPLELRLATPAPFETRPAVLPSSKVLELPAIRERVPVFEGRFRVSRDVIAPGRDRDFLISVRDSPDHARTVEIRGTLLYQACDAKVCYRPAELPVSWRLTVKLRKMPARASPENRRKS
jgi:cytochrome c biogenesis DsbD-like protein